MLKWVNAWKKAGPILQQLRDQQIRDTDTAQALLRLADAFESARMYHSPRRSSGLVEQQAYFRRLAVAKR